MANTIAKCFGYDRGRVKEDHRLGSIMAVAEAATWRTKIVATVKADGSGHVFIVRDGHVLHSYSCGPENPVVDPVTLAVS